MWNVMGASVRGPEHRREGLANQDAWLVRRTRETTLAVVCDGLGSRSQSAAGSRAACRAVADSVRHWSASPGAPPDLLLRAVHALWNIRVHAAGRDESATTCLFAVITADRRLLLAQLGDGLVLLSKAGSMTTLEPSAERFGNVTTGLGIASDLREWRIHLEPRLHEDTAVLLATDGVADDLLLERRASFLEFLVARFGALPSGSRGRALARELRSWPTPRHWDDKTLVVIWNDEKTELK